MTNASSALLPLPEVKPPQPKSRRRPFGLWAIIVIQILTMIGSGFILLIVLVAFMAAQHIIAVDGLDPSDLDMKLSAGDLITLVLAFVVNGVCAFGLWRRKRWAWFLSMLQLGFFMLTDLYSYFTNSPPETYAWSMLLNVSMVFYLNQREVQAIFLRKEER
jgi:uncharacterized membrane protein (DUF2068 family)